MFSDFRDMIREVWTEEGWFGRFIVALPVLIVFLLVIAILGLIAEQQQWDKFQQAHNCQVVGKISGSVAVTVAPIVGGNGGVAVGTSVSPDKTGWKCDDGVTYWR